MVPSAITKRPPIQSPPFCTVDTTTPVFMRLGGRSSPSNMPVCKLLKLLVSDSRYGLSPSMCLCIINTADMQ